MPLTLSSRIRDDVFILECEGEIVLGEETQTLQARIETASREFCHFVLTVNGVTRLDSSGVGLLVRCMSKLRRRGGDLRLAAPQPSLQELLRMTRLTTVLKSFPSEEEAAGSFAAEAREAASDRAPHNVIVIDRSPDFGVFIRAVLSQRGYEVRMASLVHEARLLLKCCPADFILLGPGFWQESARTTLKKWAPQASILELTPEFRSFDALRSAEVLIEMFQAGTPTA